MRLQDTTCQVTGGAQGIGKAIALHPADEGAEICIADINDAAATATAKDIGSKGGRAFASEHRDERAGGDID